MLPGCGHWCDQVQVLRCTPEYRCYGVLPSTGVTVYSWVQVLRCTPEYRCSQVNGRLANLSQNIMWHAVSDPKNCVLYLWRLANTLKTPLWHATICISLTSITGHVHVNDLDLTTQILVSSCHTCSVYAIKKFGFPRRWVPKLLRGRYRTGLTWKDQNLGRKVEVKYINEPCNAC